MFKISKRIKNALLAATTFALIVAMPDYSEIAILVFIITFVIWWVVFKTQDSQNIRHIILTMVVFPILIVITYLFYVFGYNMNNNLVWIIELILIFGIFISLIVFISGAIRIFQVELTDYRQRKYIVILKIIIVAIGASILLYKIPFYLYAMEGKLVVASISPSEKYTLKAKNKCCIICPELVTTITLKEGHHKDYSEECTINANASEPKKDSIFKWNIDEMIVSWKSLDGTDGEIDLRKDCGSPATRVDHSGGSHTFEFTSPSGTKKLFYKDSFLQNTYKQIYALKVRANNDTVWSYYRCNLDPLNELVNISSIKWGKNETIITHSVNPIFSIDLGVACDWKPEKGSFK